MALYVNGKKIVNSLVVESDAVALLPTPTETEKGSIVQFNTDLTENLLSAVAEFSASQASGTPTPATPIPIVGVDKVAIYNGGKNLIDLSSMVSGYVTTTGTFSSAHSMGEMRSDFIPVRPNTTYTFAIKETSSSYDSWCGIGLYKDNNISSFIVRRTNLWTFTTTEDTRFIVVSARNIADASQIQLEQGSDTTEYEAYNDTTALINLGDTYYGGSVDAVTGKITLTNDVINFTGSENWSYHSSGFFYTTTTIDNYKANNAVIASNGIKVRLVVGGTYAVIRIYVSDNTDYIDAQTDMQTIMTNGTQALYELATPETEYASNSAEIPTLNGINQLFADTGDVECEYFETVGHKI